MARFFAPLLRSRRCARRLRQHPSRSRLRALHDSVFPRYSSPAHRRWIHGWFFQFARAHLFFSFAFHTTRQSVCSSSGTWSAPVLKLSTRSSATPASWPSVQDLSMDSPQWAGLPLPATIDHSGCRHTRSIAVGRVAPPPPVSSLPAPCRPQTSAFPPPSRPTFRPMLPPPSPTTGTPRSNHKRPVLQPSPSRPTPITVG